MTYFQIGHSDSSKTSVRPFVEYSSNQDRASLMSAVRSRSKKHRRSRSKKSRSSTKIRVIKGKVSLRIGGFPGIQKIGASQLVRFVPVNKLRAAAKRVLGSPPRRSKKRVGQKRNKRVGQKQRQTGRHH